MKYILPTYRKSIVGLSLFLSIAVTFNSCDESISKKETVQIEEHPNWLILEPETAIKNNTALEWNFELKHSGLYVVQLVRDGIHEDLDTLVSIKIDNDSIREPLLKSYVINKTSNPQTVSEFKKTIDFKEAKSHTISIASNTPFAKIRVVPHFKNQINSGKHETEWLAMHNSPEKQAALQWFNEAKYGMFIHWGLYSQAGGIWKDVRIEESPHPGPHVAEWLMSTFQLSREEYKELAKTFNPDASFAQNIAKLAKDAGMKYVVITSKHHDGFALFDSASSEYNIVDATPYKKDAIKELYDACLEQGLDFGVYYSHGNDWMDGTDGNSLRIKKRNDSLGIYAHMTGKNYWDPSPNTYESYFENKAYPQISELLALMPKLKLIWFDGDGNINEEQSFRFYKLVYDINPSVLVNRRVGFGFGDYEDAGDNKIPSVKEVLEKQWETCGTTNGSWGFKSYDDNWKSTTEILYYFIDIASKGGNYLLNIGPDGNGDVPIASANILREVGDWLQINGDAIYGSTGWKILNEGQKEALSNETTHRGKKQFDRSFSNQEFWFTAKENKVFAISLVPIESTITIKSLDENAGKIKNVRILGSNEKPMWKQTKNGLEISVKDLISSKNGYVVEATLE
ncbi:alpha-L-fucosidase [Flagellimonas eckloniae]|uniref:alpha-L-fucosidase n=1 Tax=Flagellimonas eckloniae TaxID=346185 RepID=UPI0006DCBBA7|nr:alpha-L-fucosidase [Allomuricauda eckloniae]